MKRNNGLKGRQIYTVFTDSEWHYLTNFLKRYNLEKSKWVRDIILCSMHKDYELRKTKVSRGGGNKPHQEK